MGRLIYFIFVSHTLDKVPQPVLLHELNTFWLSVCYITSFQNSCQLSVFTF